MEKPGTLCAVLKQSISEKHANFIINSGNASAADIESLIVFIQEKVKLDHGVELVPEVKIVGEQACHDGF